MRPTVERSRLGNLLAVDAQASHGFSLGAVYNRRREIHGPYGGQTQYGISTPANQPYIFLFTNRQGLRHGYRDYFGDDGAFYYYGKDGTATWRWPGVTGPSETT